MPTSEYSLKTNYPNNTNDGDDDDHHRPIIPLDFKSVSKLPDSHTWVLTHPNPLSNSESIPVIDLSDPNAISLMRDACEKWGIFHVTHHGFPSQLLYDVELQCRRLFSLPADQKLRAIRSLNSLSGYGLSRMSTFFPKRMWSEGFTVVESPLEHAHQLWPHDRQQRDYFCNVMESCQKEMSRLAEHMMGLMFRSLGLSQQDSKYAKPKYGYKTSHGPLQLNSYPVCPDPTKAMGLAAHTDSSLLTLLCQTSSAKGLQVHKEGIGWVPVHAVYGALVVNVGDLMQILSNGRFKSVLHRAVVNKTHHRLSVAYFYGPPKDVKIEPLIQLTDINHPPLYRPITWKEYLHIKANHFHKALEFIRRAQ
ncbi:gibberellin 3-beta-dioxygenase 3-like [Humulus lupulus]|uniref:gibberellin 3-beta-dioxygenase 3-like n=1 Tax=Humulus lupulus TaxID=3486 RepID=UPI002B401230|nr:gibberellin 3-beta-dioxygenase 3-like [Humulus lupulus]